MWKIQRNEGQQVDFSIQISSAFRDTKITALLVSAPLTLFKKYKKNMYAITIKGTTEVIFF